MLCPCPGAARALAMPFPCPRAARAPVNAVPAPDALHGAGSSAERGLRFNEEDLHLGSFFFMCQDAWKNQQHITLAKNEMLTNVDISNLIDT